MISNIMTTMNKDDDEAYHQQQEQKGEQKQEKETTTRISDTKDASMHRTTSCTQEMSQLHYNMRASPFIVSPLCTETTFDW